MFDEQEPALPVLLGSVANAPYSMRLSRQSGRSTSPDRILFVSFAKNAVLFCVVVVVGVPAARAVGRGATYVETAPGGQVPVHCPGQMLLWSPGLGGLSGAVLVPIDLDLIAHLSSLLDFVRNTSLYENFTAL